MSQKLLTSPRLNLEPQKEGLIGKLNSAVTFPGTNNLFLFPTGFLSKLLWMQTHMDSMIGAQALELC